MLMLETAPKEQAYVAVAFSSHSQTGKYDEQDPNRNGGSRVPITIINKQSPLAWRGMKTAVSALLLRGEQVPVHMVVDNV